MMQASLSEFTPDLHDVAQAMAERHRLARQRVSAIHTLGPQGTNLGAAARRWFDSQDKCGKVVLHASVEEAAFAVAAFSQTALLTCAVYPDLHQVVFGHLDDLEFIDSFIYPTFPMVLASRDGRSPQVVATHPAPQGLVPAHMKRVLVSSNAQAALDCQAGLTDGCITTLAALRNTGLMVVQDFGPIPMVYTLHAARIGANHS